MSDAVIVLLTAAICSDYGAVVGARRGEVEMSLLVFSVFVLLIVIMAQREP